jgi:hypothetical protein
MATAHANKACAVQTRQATIHLVEIRHSVLDGVRSGDQLGQRDFVQVR